MFRRAMLKRSTAFLVLTLGYQAHAEPDWHADQAMPGSKGSTTRDDMTSRLIVLLRDIKAAHLNGDRMTIYDSVMPLDAEEYRSTGGCGILLVTSAALDSSELPIKRVYALLDGKIIQLTRIATQIGKFPASADGSHFPSMSREDSFYMLPVDIAIGRGVILADFAAHRVGFTVGSLPIATNDAVAPMQANGQIEVAPQVGAIKRFLEREYTGFRLKYDL